MFDGVGVSRTKISMRGKSREESKSEFLRRARDERQARELRERQRACALTLQRCWKGRLIAHRTRVAARADWDHKVGDLRRLETILAQNGAAFVPPAAVLVPLMRQFIFFESGLGVHARGHADAGDRARIGTLASFLLRNMADTNPQVGRVSRCKERHALDDAALSLRLTSSRSRQRRPRMRGGGGS